VVLNSKSSSWNPIERLIFPAPTPSYSIDSFPRELILIPREDGAKVPCLFLPFKHARFLFIYFHANAEDLGLSYGFCKIMRDLFQVHILAVEYPGYGMCPGTPDEAGIMANARAAIEFATKQLGWPSDGIKLFGRSLGTGPTCALASEYNVAGVILISPFTGIKDLFQGQVGRLADIVENRFSNIALAPRIKSPTLIIHGMQDGLVPMEHGRKLYAAITSRRMLVTPTNMSHNTSLLKDVGTFILPMTHFFSLPDYTFEEIAVPDWAFPPTTRSGEMKATVQDGEEVPEHARQLPVLGPGWLAPPTWLCGRASSGATGGSNDGAVDPVSRLDPAAEAKVVEQQSPTGYGGASSSSSQKPVMSPPLRTPPVVGVPVDCQGEPLGNGQLEGDDCVADVGEFGDEDVSMNVGTPQVVRLKTAPGGNPNLAKLEVSREYNFSRAGEGAMSPRDSL